MSYEKDPELKIPDRTPSADIDATAIDSASHEAMASPEEISATHSKLKTLIMSVPDEYIWNFSPKRGPGDSQDNIPHLRLMSLPTETREDGSMRGESFVWISYFDKESLDDSAEIKVTIDHGSGNPWGDVLNNAGVKVDKIRRKEITFGPEGQSRTRHGRFTFGPAELERKENLPVKTVSQEDLKIIEVVALLFFVVECLINYSQFFLSRYKSNLCKKK